MAKSIDLAPDELVDVRLRCLDLALRHVADDQDQYVTLARQFEAFAVGGATCPPEEKGAGDV